jgi:pyruvate/2-oxoacid:ferredoxin oxidoreductase alpha subunit
MRKVIIGNHAASYGVMLSRVKVISAYPITPQTQIVELLSELCACGKLDATFIEVESEHSAMASLIGAASTGVRTFTATSSQGLALMHELLHWAAGGRLPIVMTNVNRALAPGWNIWTDQTDSLAQRDTGWIQVYCESGQEILDNVIMAYMLAERVMIPVMIVYDAFYLSHTSEPVDIPEQEEVDEILPPYNPDICLDPERPGAVGGILLPNDYMDFKYRQQKAMEAVPGVVETVTGEFFSKFNRRYGMLEEYRMDDAEKVVVCASTMAGTARIIIDELRGRGEKIGMVKIRFFRPFPYREMKEALSGRDEVIVIDRNLSPGMGGIFAQEIRNGLYGVENPPSITGTITGLGGKGVTPEVLREIITGERRITGDAPIHWQGVGETGN